MFLLVLICVVSFCFFCFLGSKCVFVLILLLLWFLHVVFFGSMFFLPVLSFLVRSFLFLLFCLFFCVFSLFVLFFSLFLVFVFLLLLFFVVLSFDL